MNCLSMCAYNVVLSKKHIGKKYNMSNLKKYEFYWQERLGGANSPQTNISYRKKKKKQYFSAIQYFLSSEAQSLHPQVRRNLTSWLCVLTTEVPSATRTLGDRAKRWPWTWVKMGLPADLPRMLVSRLGGNIPPAMGSGHLSPTTSEQLHRTCVESGRGSCPDLSPGAREAVSPPPRPSQGATEILPNLLDIARISTLMSAGVLSLYLLREGRRSVHSLTSWGGGTFFT